MWGCFRTILHVYSQITPKTWSPYGISVVPIESLLVNDFVSSERANEFVSFNSHGILSIDKLGMYSISFTVTGCAYPFSCYCLSRDVCDPPEIVASILTHRGRNPEHISSYMIGSGIFVLYAAISAFLWIKPLHRYDCKLYYPSSFVGVLTWEQSPLVLRG